MIKTKYKTIAVDKVSPFDCLKKLTNLWEITSLERDCVGWADYNNRSKKYYFETNASSVWSIENLTEIVHVLKKLQSQKD